MRVVIAAAGTGGHINPAIAIANKIKEYEPNSKIMFIGTDTGLEIDLVPRAGYELQTIPAHGLSKKISVENFKNMLETLKGIENAKKLLEGFKPDVVVGTGGYICGPVFLAAKKLKIPTVVHESNAFPGRAVKMLAKDTDAILLGFKDAEKRVGKAKKIVVTGNPTKVNKKEYSEIEKQKILQEYNLSIELPVVLAFGGSQGAKAINDALLGIIENKLNEKYQIVWATGPRQYEVIKEELEKHKIDIENVYNMQIVPYIYDMEKIMNVCDLIVARSGAMSITEVARVGKPAIFIPLPNVSQNHQDYNADVLVNIGAAEKINNAELTDSLLSSSIEKIVEKKDKIVKMGNIAKTVDVDNVEENIYNEILKVIKNIK